MAGYNNVKTEVIQMTSTITIRLDSDLKKKLVRELQSIGLSIEEYFNLAAHQLVIQKRVPFELLAESARPSAITKKALVAAQAKELGIIPDDSPSFDDVEEVKSYLNHH